MHFARYLFLASLVITGGCAMNPVTGKPDFIAVSPAQEIAMGEQAYLPSQQSQGGIYDIDPALTEYVREVGGRVAAYAENPLPYEFVILNNSVPNAWALPGGKIAINRGLLTELNSEAELAAVLGHEVVHAAARHSAQQISRGAISQILVVTTAVVTGNGQFGQLAVGSAAAAAELSLASYGRSAELESDRYGMSYMSSAGYDPAGAVTLQETFVRLSEGQEQDWLSGLFASHPPSLDRVKANRKTAASLPPGGELGVERYEAALARTRAAIPAYEAYDEGRQALADGDLEKALELAETALDQVPEEAHFHSLRGDVRLLQEDYAAAEIDYTNAIELRGDFFYYPVQRGIARKELGRPEDARADLEASIEIVPTAPAYYALGELAEERGDPDAALEYYGPLVREQGPYGDAARKRFARIDLPSNPGAYVPYNCVAGSQQNLIVQVRNDAPEPIRNIEFAVVYTGADGLSKRLEETLPGPLAPGDIVSIDTGLAPYGGESCPVTVTNAEFADAGQAE
jgi:predicted Zn-dependent protease